MTGAVHVLSSTVLSMIMGAAPSFIQTPFVRTFATGTASDSSSVSSSSPIELRDGESLVVAWWSVASPSSDVTSALWGSAALTPVVLDPPSGETLQPLGNDAILRVFKLTTPQAPGAKTVTVTCGGVNERMMLIAMAVEDAQDANIVGVVKGIAEEGAKAPQLVIHTPGRSNVRVIGVHALTAPGTSSPTSFSGFSHGEIAQVNVDNRVLAAQCFVNHNAAPAAVACSWSGDASVASVAIEIRPVMWISLVEDVVIDVDPNPPAPPTFLGKIITHNIEYYPGGNRATPVACGIDPDAPGGPRFPIPPFVVNQHEALESAYADYTALTNLTVLCGQEFFAPHEGSGIGTLRILNDYLDAGWAYRVSSAFAIDNRGSAHPDAEQYHPSMPGPDSVFAFDPKDFDTGECHSNIHNSSPFRPEIVIGSRFPIVAAAEIEVLHNTTIDPTYVRGALYAGIELPDDQMLHVYNLHVRIGSAFNSHRPFVSRAILDHMVANEIDPEVDWVIVTGDWNANYGTSNKYMEAAFALLTDNGFRNTWDNVHPDDRITRHATGTGEPATIDMAFVSAGMEADLGVLDAAIVPNSGRSEEEAIDDLQPGEVPGIASDHFAFTLTLGPAPECHADLTGNGSVGVPDLLLLLSAWGHCPPDEPCPADLTGDGKVGVSDLLVLLSKWGECSP